MTKITNREHLESVAQNLERAIEALGLTRTEAAASMGISLQKLGNWLRPDNYPDPYLLTVFCDRYGVTADFIYRGVVSGLRKDVADDLAKALRASKEADQGESPLAAKTKRKKLTARE